MLGDDSFEIIGVTPARLLRLGSAGALSTWRCLSAPTKSVGSTLRNRLVADGDGRLKPGWSFEQATGSVAGHLASVFEQTLPANYHAGQRDRLFGLPPGEAVSAATGYSVLRRNYEGSLWLLSAIAGHWCC